ncbi:MAG: CDF family Co(II)/Ni(II) efflux transporter DmeF [Kofleriaceae bacterium]
MKAHELSAHVHHEDADDEAHNKAGERRTRWVVAIAAVMMVGELTVGWITGSMALTADGWHMGTHVGALGLTLVAYWYARTRAGTDTFSFGTGKVYALAGYTSGVLLAMVALLMAIESIEHLIHPHDIAYDEALAVASLGLVVNLVSVWLLSKGHHYGHGHSHGHAPAHGHSHVGQSHDGHAHGDHENHAARDHAHAKPKPQPGTLDFNMRAAFIHVAADAMTSVMAIVALSLGKWQGWWFLDPTMGLVGGVVIVWWAISLCRQASGQLLDVVGSPKHERAVRKRLEEIDDVRVADLHVWELGPGRRSAIVSIVSSTPRDVQFYRQAVLDSVTLAHLTIEVHACALPHEDVGKEAHVTHRHEH